MSFTRIRVRMQAPLARLYRAIVGARDVATWRTTKRAGARRSTKLAALVERRTT